MTNTGGPSSRHEGERPPWAARIRCAGGDIAGAGVLIGADLVLTAARNLSEAPPRTAEFGAAAVAALADDGTAPAGGVALLRLAAPRPAGHPATLRRTAVVRRAVRVHGARGAAMRAEVTAATGGDGRVPLRRVDRGEWAGGGWQGAAVADEATGAVIGIALADGRGAPVLVPAETVLRHLPRLAAHTSGLPAVPGPLLARTRTRSVDATAAKWFTGWAAEPGRPVAVGVLPEHDAAAAATLRACLTLADREHHATLPAGHPLLAAGPALPPVGSVDLVLDAAGLSVDRIAELVAERLGLAGIAGRDAASRLSAAGPPPLRCVVLGVDRSARPADLLDLLGTLTDGGSRLLLVFRDQGAASRRIAATELPVRAWRAQLADIRRRLTETVYLARTDLYDRVARVRADLGPVRDALRRASSARAYLAELPDPPTGPGEPEDLGPYARLADSARRRVEEAVDRLDRLIAARDELRGTLRAYRALDLRTARHEDREAARLYLAAHHILHTGACDVATAAEALRRYTDHVDARPDASIPLREKGDE